MGISPLALASQPSSQLASNPLEQEWAALGAKGGYHGLQLSPAEKQRYDELSLQLHGPPNADTGDAFSSLTEFGQGLIDYALPVWTAPILGATGASAALSSSLNIPSAASNALIGGIRSGISGGDPLKGALSAGLNSAAGSLFSGNTLTFPSSDYSSVTDADMTGFQTPDAPLNFGPDQIDTSSYSFPEFATNPFDQGAFAQGGNMAFTDDYGDFTDMSGFQNNDATNFGPTTLDNSSYNTGGIPDYLGGAQPNNGFVPDGYTVDLSNSGNIIPTGGGFDWASLLKQAPGLAKLLMSGGSAAAGSGAGGLSDLVKSIMGGGGSSNLLSQGVAAAPILAAINYAQNQNGADTSQLDQIFGQLSPDALAGQYDQNTASGRAQLNANLVRRGVSGSSFANQDLTSFDTTRDLGRSQLIQGGLGTQAQIAGTTLNAKLNAQKNKNDLYGRSLLALGSVFAPKPSLLAGL